jgi:acetyltransferase
VNDSSRPSAPPPPPPPGYPAGLERTWQAADGTAVRIRALRPDDVEREIRFIEGLSPETLYQRTHYFVRSISRSDANRLLDLDYDDTMAVGAFLGPPDERLIGVSRYARIEGTDRAECAIVVADDWSGRGVGTELMRSLALAARQRGYRALEGSSLAANDRIHAWARRFGFEVGVEPNSGGQVRITVELSSLPA